MDVTADGRPVAGGIPSFTPPLSGTHLGTRGYDPFPGAAQSRSKGVFVFFSDTLPRRVYLYFSLTLPLLYVSRVNEIFEKVKQSKPEIQEKVQTWMASDVRTAPAERTGLYVPITMRPFAPHSEAIDSLIKSWEYFVGSLVKEWKTLNIVSVLLSSAILTTLQLDGAATDPYTRYFAFLALVCSLMSVLYGCIYIIRFDTMGRTRKIVEWAEQARKTKASIWWNIETLLAIPVIWFSWSFIFYLICIMTLLWRTGTTGDTVVQITPLAALGPRIAVTFVLVLGLVYLCLIIREFRRYGNAMDEKWKNTLYEWKNNPQNDPSNGIGLAPQQGVLPMVHPPVFSDMEGNGPPMLPNQGIAWSDGPMNRHRYNLRRPAEYNSKNLAKRPTDWRSDYRVRRTMIQKPRTSVDEFQDLMERTIHENLSYVPSGPRIIYDLRFPPYTQALCSSVLGRPYNYQLATNPPVDRMRLLHPLLPWYIDVHQSQANGVTVEDVFLQLFSELQSQIGTQDYFNEELGNGTRERIASAFERRALGSEEEKEMGIRRVDYLEDKMVFVGLVRVKDGLWEMKTVTA